MEGGGLAIFAFQQGEGNKNTRSNGDCGSGQWERRRGDKKGHPILRGWQQLTVVAF